MSIPSKPFPDILPHPVGAHDWHVQIERNGRFLKIGGSEGSRAFAHGFLVAWRLAHPEGPELRLCDAKGHTFLVE